VEVLCSQEACIHEADGKCTANGISLTAYSEYPDDIECDTFEWEEDN
jgi:hypothetical protein